MLVGLLTTTLMIIRIARSVSDTRTLEVWLSTQEGKCPKVITISTDKAFWMGGEMSSRVIQTSPENQEGRSSCLRFQPLRVLWHGQLGIYRNLAIFIAFCSCADSPHYHRLCIYSGNLNVCLYNIALISTITNAYKSLSVSMCVRMSLCKFCHDSFGFHTFLITLSLCSFSHLHVSLLTKIHTCVSPCMTGRPHACSLGLYGPFIRNVFYQCF